MFAVSIWEVGKRGFVKDKIFGEERLGFGLRFARVANRISSGMPTDEATARRARGVFFKVNVVGHLPHLPGRVPRLGINFARFFML
jgi:hypothetical protein